MDAEMLENKYVLSLDVGTTSLRCFIYNKSTDIIGRSSRPLKMIYPEQQGVEIEPELLWENIVCSIKEALVDASITADMIASIGICTQRGTFIVWDKSTGRPFHNFIVWQDTRADCFAKEWNNSYIMKIVQAGSKTVHAVTRNKKFLAAAVIRYSPQHVSMRLLWLFKRYPEVKTLAMQGKASFATLDTWIIWKLTCGKEFVTEYSCACVTGLYDPFILEWSDFFCKLLGIPKQMFPPVKDTSGDFGLCNPSLFGAPIPICAVIGDQQSAMFGQCCFDPGDTKLTLGTGAFLNMNVGENPHASVAGFYPVIGWKIGSKITHLAEGSSNTAGNAIDWLKNMSLISEPSKADDIAKMSESFNDANVYFVPAFNGIQAPVNDYLACSSIVGLNQDTRPCHVVKAVLESLAFRNKQLYESMKSETSLQMKRFVCDGGVAASKFVMQLSADLIGKDISVQTHTEMSGLGAAFLAGLHVKYWKSQDELKQLIKVYEKYSPDRETALKYQPIFKQWWKACKRSMNWYEPL